MLFVKLIMLLIVCWEAKGAEGKARIIKPSFPVYEQLVVPRLFGGTKPILSDEDKSIPNLVDR